MTLKTAWTSLHASRSKRRLLRKATKTAKLLMPGANYAFGGLVKSDGDRTKSTAPRYEEQRKGCSIDTFLHGRPRTSNHQVRLQRRSDVSLTLKAMPNREESVRYEY